MTELSTESEFVRGIVLSAICRPSRRDLQKMPGPSDLADPCDVCVARKIARACGRGVVEESPTTNLKAWTGTATHQKLEKEIPKVYPSAELELSVKITEIPGLGTIKGHTDLYEPRRGSVVDIKTTDMEKLAKYQTKGVPHRHRGQTSLYGYGIRASGRTVHTISLVYIPRDSMYITDIWVHTFPYDETYATALLNRARSLTEVVRSRKTGSLERDPDCWTCK